MITFCFAFLLFITPELLETFDKEIEQERARWKVPGVAVGIVQGEKVYLAKGYGTRGLKDKRAVDDKTLFQIGSISKSFTSALVAKGVDRGDFKWEDSVINHLPTFRMFDPWVTIQFQVVDLLCQRSGLPNHAGDSQVFLGGTAEEMIRNLRFIEPVTSFRSTYAYQNIFFLVAAEILEKKTGYTFSRLLESEIFAPLEMKSSSSSVEEYLKNNNRSEWLYRSKDGSTVSLSDDFPYRDWNYILGPAGGINSNVEDMTKWLIFQANQGKFRGQQLISKENMAPMKRPYIFVSAIGEREAYYGLGWVRLEESPYPIIWHDGATLGAYAVAAFIPEEQLGIVVLSNERNTSLSLALALQFFDRYFDKPDHQWSEKLLQKEEESKKNLLDQINKAPPSNPSSFLGTYTNQMLGEATVKEEKGQLVLVIGKKKINLAMKPVVRNVYTIDWSPVWDEPIKVIFVPGDLGNIDAMKIDVFEAEGSGIFKKV